jgi:outer membrane biosynthesis protein TonB
MRDAAIKSGLLHLIVALVGWFGVPALFDDPPISENVIVIDMVEIAELRNLPNQIVEPDVDQEPEAEQEPPPPEPDKVETATPPPPPPPQPSPAPQEIAEPAPEPEPEPEPLEVAEPDPISEPLPELAALPKPEPKPEPEPEPEPRQVAQIPQEVSRPKRKPKPPSRLDFEKALESLDDIDVTERVAPVEEETEPETTEELLDPIDQLLASADTPYRSDAPLSMSEIDNIRSQIQKNWNVPGGARGAESMAVTLRITLRQDGTVTSVDVAEKDKQRMREDGFFRTMAESAIRAVNTTRQIKYLSPDKYHLWNDITLKFDPKEMFG